MQRHAIQNNVTKTEDRNTRVPVPYNALSYPLRAEGTKQARPSSCQLSQRVACRVPIIANFTFDRRYRSPICSHAGTRAPSPAATFPPILSLYNNVPVLDPSLPLPRSTSPLPSLSRPLFERTQGARGGRIDREKEGEKRAAYYARTYSRTLL